VDDFDPLGYDTAFLCVCFLLFGNSVLSPSDSGVQGPNLEGEGKMFF
jgi:hypothetical protein